MMLRRWNKLKKIHEWYQLEPEPIASKNGCSKRINFTQLAFACDNERLIAVDSKGIAYYLELSNEHPSYRQLGYVGQATFVAFNPNNLVDILIGLTSGDIKILKIHENMDHFALLFGHKVPAMHISFYKCYCLTSSCKEVIIWYLTSYSKAHQLHINTKDVTIKKASFSNLGHVVVLYCNDAIQTWMLNKLDKDTKIEVKDFGLRHITNFAFTQNGRALILTSQQNKLLVLSTCNWNIIKNLNLPENFIGIKQVRVIPLPLDGGANKIIAVVSTNCTLHIFDINSSCFLDKGSLANKVKKIDVSSDGRYIAIIDKEGILRLTFCEKLLYKDPPPLEKVKPEYKPRMYKVNEHLSCIQKAVKQELRLDRLLPILREFREYPKKYRLTIWSTILKLPANKKSFISLTNKATSSAFVLNAIKKYKLADRSKASLLTTTMDYLVQWCPMFSQVSFLPNLIFPFLVVFQKDSLLAFELVLSILLNFCQKWFEYHPLPPLNILGIIENILLEADPLLLNVFCERGVTSTEYAWPLLQTTLSEVLSADEWLILWDHLLSIQKPTLLLMCVVAFNICSRNIIISALHSLEDFKQFYITQGHIRAKDLLTVAQQLDQNISYRNHPNCYLRDKLIFLPSSGPYPPFIQEEYPKYFTDKDNALYLSKLRKCNEILQEQKQQAISAEEKRLHRETEAFLEQVHQTRLNEVQRCLQAQVHNVDVQLQKSLDKTQRDIVELPFTDSDSDESENIWISSNKESKDYIKLQKGVEKLENEVQSLLHSLRRHK